MEKTNFDPKIIAFYLPQFHPIPENDEWHSKGFTEWTNVAMAKPQFHGHLQPRVPADLGFYDLRVPETRKAQAELAKQAGISAFCYYHYWFGEGKMLLERPLEEVVKSGEPDFPFCICWANHSWYKKNWNPRTQRKDNKLLIEQRYSDEDMVNHFNYLLPMFKDERYFKWNGKLLFVIYNINDIPSFNRMKETWNEMAQKNGLPTFYFVSNTKLSAETDIEPYSETDGVILSLVFNIINYEKRRHKLLHSLLYKLFHTPRSVYRYEDAIPFFIDKKCKNDNVIPVIVPTWDYTPRLGSGGLILRDSTPNLFKKHAKQVLEYIANKPVEKQLVFLKSWNEWGEGNYMEPDTVFGKGYITALKEAIEESHLKYT